MQQLISWDTAEVWPDGRGLWTLACSVDIDALRSELASAQLPSGIATRLKPCGDIAADLSDAGVLQHYGTVRAILESRGWLMPPGSV